MLSFQNEAKGRGNMRFSNKRSMSFQLLNWDDTPRCVISLNKNQDMKETLASWVSFINFLFHETWSKFLVHETGDAIYLIQFVIVDKLNEMHGEISLEEEDLS